MRRGDGVQHELAAIDDAPLERLAPRQLQKVVDGPAGALDLRGDLLHVPRHAGIRDLELLETARHQIRRALHHAQRIPQLMSDAGGELADGRQTLGRSVLGQQVVPVGLEHDRQLDVQDLVQRRQHPLERLGRHPGRLPEHIGRPKADAIHRREHVHLRKVDLDVNSTDPGPPLEVVVVVGPLEQLVDPPQQRLLQPGNLGRPAGDGRARVRMRLDRRVEVVDDRPEVRRDQRMRLAEGLRRGVIEPNVSLHVFAEGPEHAAHVITQPAEGHVRAGRHREKPASPGTGAHSMRDRGQRELGGADLLLAFVVHTQWT